MWQMQKNQRCDEDEIHRHTKRQSTLQRKVSPAAVKSLVAEYIIDNMLPLSTVVSSFYKAGKWTLVKSYSVCGDT